MTKWIFTPSYMRDFQCLGGDCEDTCCQNWDIRLDKAHYELLAKKFSSDDMQRSTFDTYVKKNEDENSSEDFFAAINLNESGFCPFLNQSGLCAIHVKFGVQPLSNVCTFFPRVFSRYKNKVEMTGALSCPEVVRQCLFGDEKSQQIKRFSSNILPRENFPLARDIGDSDDDYLTHYKQVQEQLLTTIRDNEYSFEARLYFLANFTYRLAQHYHLGCESKTKLIDEEIRRINSEKIKKQLDDYFFQFSSTEPVAIIVVQSILQLRLQHQGKDKLSKLIKHALDNYMLDYRASDDFEIYGDNMPPDRLWNAFQAHWEKLNSKYGAWLEEYLTRYTINCLQREWFLSFPDPFVYIQMLIIRIGVLRFLITSHPDMLVLLRADKNARESKQEFDDLVVEVMYLFARSIDHNHNFLHVVFQALFEQQLMTFDYSMPFIKF